MIKIIKEGIKPKRYKYIYSLVCTDCTCEFEFEESDCTAVRHEKRIDGEHRGEIDCPFCSKRLFIDFKTVNCRKEEITEESIPPANIYTELYIPWDRGDCDKCPNKNEMGDACYCCPHHPYKITCNAEVKK